MTDAEADYIKGLIRGFSPEKPLMLAPEIYRRVAKDDRFSGVMDRVRENKPIALNGRLTP